MKMNRRILKSLGFYMIWVESNLFFLFFFFYCEDHHTPSKRRLCHWEAATSFTADKSQTAHFVHLILVDITKHCR